MSSAEEIVAWTDLDRALFQLAPMDPGVFESIEVHRGMLSDKRVVSAYQAAIQRIVKPGAVALDLGAGLGILSFFAARSGAAKVYAIERNRTIRLAGRIAATMGLSDSLVFVHGASSEVELAGKADLIVSQTLGHLGFEEDIVRWMIEARDRFLGERGRLVPCRVELFLVPADSSHMEHALAFWQSRPYGLDLSPVIDHAINNIYVIDIEQRQLLAKPEPIYSSDLRTAVNASLSGELRMRAERTGVVRGLAGWFRAQLVDELVIDTAPGAPRTHWRQCFLPISDPFPVVVGDRLEVRVEMISNSNGDPLWRWSVSPGSPAQGHAHAGRIQSTSFASF